MRWLVLVFLAGCAQPQLQRIPLASNTLWQHELTPHWQRTLQTASRILTAASGCDWLIASGPQSEPGIHVYAFEAPEIQPSRCGAPYVAVTANGRRALVNLCGQQINPALWSHIPDQDTYLLLHLISEAFGLPPTQRAASYTANGPNVMRPTKRLFLHFTRGERHLLQTNCHDSSVRL